MVCECERKLVRTGTQRTLRSTSSIKDLLEPVTAAWCAVCGAGRALFSKFLVTATVCVCLNVNETPF